MNCFSRCEGIGGLRHHAKLSWTMSHNFRAARALPQRCRRKKTCSTIRRPRGRAAVRNTSPAVERMLEWGDAVAADQAQGWRRFWARRRPTWGIDKRRQFPLIPGSASRQGGDELPCADSPPPWRSRCVAAGLVASEEAQMKHRSKGRTRRREHSRAPERDRNDADLQRSKLDATVGANRRPIRPPRRMEWRQCSIGDDWD